MEVVVSHAGDSFDVFERRPLFSDGFEFKAEGRSSRWPALARLTVEAHPFCACCDARRDLQVHHVIPVHVDAAKELEPDNLIVLCRRCHLLVGHLGWWASWNESVAKDSSEWLEKIRRRPFPAGAEAAY